MLKSHLCYGSKESAEGNTLKSTSKMQVQLQKQSMEVECVDVGLLSLFLCINIWVSMTW